MSLLCYYLNFLFIRHPLKISLVSISTVLSIFFVYIDKMKYLIMSLNIINKSISYVNLFYCYNIYSYVKLYFLLFIVIVSL
jgi:hypothetical protein